MGKSIHRGNLIKLIVVVLTALICSACAGNQESLSTASLLQKEIRRYLIMGERYYTHKDYDRAAAAYNNLLMIDALNTEAHFKLGIICLKQGEFDRSLYQFLETISIDNGYAKAYYNIGVIYSSDTSYYHPQKAAFYFKRYLHLAKTPKFTKEVKQWLREHTGSSNNTDKP